MKLSIIGTGQMAIEYVKVATHLNLDFEVIGRGEQSANSFYNKTTIKPYLGGLRRFLDDGRTLCDFTIVAVGVEELATVTTLVINTGIKNMLIEKPGALRKKDLVNMNNLCKKFGSRIFIAYNRRFYSSVLKLKELIKAEGGVLSFNFEFTEFSNMIQKIEKTKEVKERWFLSNSTHVVDLAFYLGGMPKNISAYKTGNLSWHPSGAVYSGAGISESGALFSYQANWNSAGRWGVEILTAQNRYFLKPLEKLQVQKRETVVIDEYSAIDYTYDEKFKPGLLKELEFFINGKTKDFVTLEDTINRFDLFTIISGEDYK